MASDKRRKLNNTIVDDLEPKEKRFTEWDGVQPHFGVRVSAAKPGKPPVKSFIVRGRMKGKSRDPVRLFTLGRFPEMNVATARRLAREYATQLANGIDPNAKVRAQSEIPTFGEAARTFIDSKHRSPRTTGEYEIYLDGHLKRFKNLTLNQITHDDVRALHNSLRKTPTMANRVIAFLKAVYKPQLVVHDVPDPVADFKNGGGRKYKESRRKVDPPHYVLPRWYRGINEIIPDHKQKVRDVIYFAIYSGLRRSEVCGLQWSNIDEKAGTFTVTVKGDKQLTVHLTHQLREILARRRADTMEGCDWVFPSATGNRREGKLPTGPMTSFRGKTGDLFNQISEAGGAKFWLHATRNTYLTVCRDLGFPKKMRKFLVGHEPGEETGDVTEDYEGDFSPEHVAAAAQVAANRIEAFMFERVAPEDLKPAWLAAAEVETAAAMTTNIYSLDVSRMNRAI